MSGSKKGPFLGRFKRGLRKYDLAPMRTPIPHSKRRTIALKRVLWPRCPAGTREARLFFSDRTVYMEVSAKG